MLSAILSLTAAVVIVRAGGLRVALPLLRRAARTAVPRITARRLGTLAHATADVLPVVSSCLERSVAIAWLLLRRGHRCALVVESQTDRGSFLAHAWVDTVEGALGATATPAAEIVRWQLPDRT